MDVHQEIGRKNDASSALSHENQANDNLVMLPIELMNTTGKYLHQLNEDCLLEIFSSNSLTPLDLCSLAETCKLFKRIIQDVVPKEFGIETICEGRYILNWKGHEVTYTDLLDVERILKNFGHRLSALSFWSWNKTIANSVAKYSSDVTLKELTLYDTESVLGSKFKSILQRLLKLQIFSYRSLDWATWSDINFDSLIELKIHIDATTGFDAVLRNSFPNLQRFSSSMPHGDVNSVYNFIERQRSLKFLEVVFDKDIDIELMHIIGNNCKELEELCLSQVYTRPKSLDLSYMQSLTKLKKLDVNISYATGSLYVELLRELKSLEIVKINFEGYEASVSHVFDALSQLPNLRQLDMFFLVWSPIMYTVVDHFDLQSWSTFTPWNHLALVRKVPWTHLALVRKLKVVALGSFASEHFVDIIKQLTNLEEFEFIDLERLYKLDEESFSRILKIVEERRIVLTLKCDFDFVNNCDERQKVRLIKNMC